EAVLLGIEHEVDLTLGPARHRLRAVEARTAEAKPAEQRLEAWREGIVDRELDELDALAADALGQGREARDRMAGPAPELIQHEEQRAPAVDGDAAGRAGAEAVVEDLQRQDAAEAGRVQRIHEGIEREVALAGEAAVVPTPGEIVHVEHRRVGDLDQEDA